MSEYIVLSTEHYNPLGIIRTLGEAGIHPYVVCQKDSFQMLCKSRYAKECFYVDNPDDGVQLILDKFPGKPEDKNIILTGNDTSVAAMDRRYDDLKDGYIFYNAGKQGRLSYYMQKPVMMELVARHGLNVIKTWKTKKGEIPSDIVYPIMTKAETSIGKEWKSIVFICHDEKELLDAYSRMQSEEVMLQQYIEKTDEYSFDGIAINHGKEAHILFQASQVYNLPKTYSPYWKIFNNTWPEFDKISSEILGEVGFEGIYEFEFLVDKEGKLWFLEINFRNTALGFASTVVDMPTVTTWVESMKSGHIDTKKIDKLIPEGVTAMAECWDYDARVKTGMLSKKEWKKQYKAAQCKMYRGRHDFWPFFAFMWHKYRNKGKA